MNKYSLLTEPWIVVMLDDRGSTKKVSLQELFLHAQDYKDLAGETKTQDFAILRLLLAVLHTVFTRFDSSGKPYDYIELNQDMIQIGEVEEEDIEDYEVELFETWVQLWKSEQLPSVIVEYLKKQADKFNLYDEKYPFYQITEEDIQEIQKMTRTDQVKTGDINFKLINRLISESENKISLFSSRTEENKGVMSDDEYARWLIAFQAYTGTADKAKYPNMRASANKGWLLGLGGIYLKGRNLKETLLLNTVLSRDVVWQRPIWEKSFRDKLKDLMNKIPDNLSELYTNLSRLIVKRGEGEDKISAIQLQAINTANYLLEPMTLWQFAKSGENKGSFVPKTHQVNQSLWKSFGNLRTSLQDEKNTRQAKIIDWYVELIEQSKNYDFKVDAIIVATAYDYNRDASTMIKDEIYDELDISKEIIAKAQEDGWIPRITSEVELVKEVIDSIFGTFLSDVKTIRNLNAAGFVDSHKQDAYFTIDRPFRDWLSHLREGDEKEVKIREWRERLYSIILDHGNSLVRGSGKRDILGNGDMNISMAFNKFYFKLNNKLERGGSV